MSLTALFCTICMAKSAPHDDNMMAALGPHAYLPECPRALQALTFYLVQLFNSHVEAFCQISWSLTHTSIALPCTERPPHAANVRCLHDHSAALCQHCDSAAGQVHACSASAAHPLWGLLDSKLSVLLQRRSNSLLGTTDCRLKYYFRSQEYDTLVALWQGCTS